MHLLHPSKGCCFVRSASCPFSPPLPLFSPLTVMKGELRQLSFSPLLYAARDGERRERRFSRTHPHPFPFLLPPSATYVHGESRVVVEVPTYLYTYLHTHSPPHSFTPALYEWPRPRGNNRYAGRGRSSSFCKEWQQGPAAAAAATARTGREGGNEYNTHSRTLRTSRNEKGRRRRNICERRESTGGTRRDECWQKNLSLA